MRRFTTKKTIAYKGIIFFQNYEVSNVALHPTNLVKDKEELKKKKKKKNRQRRKKRMKNNWFRLYVEYLWSPFRLPLFLPGRKIEEKIHV